MPAPNEYTQDFGQYVEDNLVALGRPPFGQSPPPPPPPPPPGLVIPPTLPPNAPGFAANESFRLMTANKDTGQNWFDAEYIAHGMPYVYSEGIPGNHDHAWWVAGDREGYRCAYAFMYDKHPAPFGQEVIRRPGEGHFIARVTFVRPPDAAYGKVNDKYMDEGIRYYDGALSGQSKGELDQDAMAASLSDFDYEPWDGPGHQNIRVGLFRADGEIGDIRDFNDVVVHASNIKFRVIPENNVSPDGHDRVAIAMYEDDLPGMIVYYDTMSDGRIAVEYDD